jgi:hypothetical protein
VNSANLQFDAASATHAREQFENLLTMLAQAMPNASICVSIYANVQREDEKAYQWGPGLPAGFIDGRVERGKTISEIARVDAEEIAESDPYRGQLEVITKAELIKLLNEYSAKHPKKSAGAREVLQTFGGTRLGDIEEDNWPKLAASLRAFLEQVA